MQIFQDGVYPPKHVHDGGGVPALSHIPFRFQRPLTEPTRARRVPAGASEMEPRTWDLITSICSTFVKFLFATVADPVLMRALVPEGGVEKKFAPTATKKKGGRKRQCPALCEVCLRPSSPALLRAFSTKLGPSNDCPCACFARFWLPDGCPGSFQAGPVTWKRTV